MERKRAVLTARGSAALCTSTSLTRAYNFHLKAARFLGFKAPNLNDERGE
jgi:hypothetical protein